MTILADFLKQYRTKWLADAPKREARRHEWREAVGRLVETIKGWLHDADPEGKLTVREEPHTIREAVLGELTAPALVIEYKGREIRVVPMACDEFVDLGVWSKGAGGEADITDGYFHFPLIYRPYHDGKDWALYKDAEYGAERLDRATFEEVLLELLTV